MLKVRRVIIHSLYFYFPTRLLHESVFQKGLIIQIKPTLCCRAEEGIGILKSCFQERKEDIGDEKSSSIQKQARTRAPEGTARKGSHANVVDPAGSCHAAEGLSQRNRLGKRRGRGWELTQRPSGEDERLSTHCISQLVGRLRF